MMKGFDLDSVWSLAQGIGQTLKLETNLTAGK